MRSPWALTITSPGLLEDGSEAQNVDVERPGSR